MPDPTSHAPDMISVIRVIRPSAMPRLWWLNPWAAAKYLHSAATALKAYADRADRALKAAQDSREHWINKHDRAYAVAMHNERVIREMETWQATKKGGQP